MGILDFLFGKDDKPEKTIVYMRDLFSGSPARHWESVVDYDPWGRPFAYDYRYGERYVERPEELKPNGQYGSYSCQHWKHKSGPPVSFEMNGNPQKTWFPSNPNDKLPLN